LSTGHRPIPAGAAWWFVVAMLPFAVVALIHSTWPPPAWAGDYAQYLSHARAIAEGRPYADIGYIYHREAWTIGPPAYPPGLPLTLAPLVALAGVDSALIRLFTTLALALFAWFAFRRLARDIAPHLAAIGAGLTALSIELGLGALVPMSDLPFAALLWGWVLIADHEERWSWGRVAAVTALGLVLFSYRVAGIAIIPALGLYGLLRWRRDSGRSLVPVAAWIAMGVTALALGLVRNPYADGVSAVQLSLDTQLRIIRGNYRLMLMEAELYPFGLDRWDDAYHIVASLIVAVGGVVLAWGLRRSLLFLLIVAYGAMLALAPVADLRYAWPMFPLVGASLALGIQTIVSRVGRGTRVAVPATLAICAAIALGAVRHSLSEPRPYSIVGTPDADTVYAWMAAQHQSSPMRLMFTNPRVVTLETRVPAMGIPPRTTPGLLVAIEERRITHLLTEPDSVSGCLQRLANALPREFPKRFQRVYANRSFEVYRVVPSAVPFEGAYKKLRWGEQQRCDFT
jgi:hypothetical protein